MKKFFVVIAVFLVLICTKEVKNDFTLLDYFSGEYTTYSQTAQGENCVNLGFCYMQNEIIEKENLIGESLKISNFEPIDALKQLNAKVVKTEYLDNGTIVIYAYSSLIKDKVEVDNKNVNLQIAQYENYSIIGWPLILGSF